MILNSESECRKCGKFDTTYDDSIGFHLIICPMCNEELGAIYKQFNPKGIEYMKSKGFLKDDDE